MFSLTPHTLTLSPLLCIPVGSDIVVYELFSGKKIKKLRGHYGSVSCCAVSGRELELYSGGSDSNILVWSPPQVSCGSGFDGSDNILWQRNQGAPSF